MGVNNHNTTKMPQMFCKLHHTQLNQYDTRLASVKCRLQTANWA